MEKLALYRQDVIMRQIIQPAPTAATQQTTAARRMNANRHAAGHRLILGSSGRGGSSVMRVRVGPSAGARKIDLNVDDYQSQYNP
jgi:hypothetical protein